MMDFQAVLTANGYSQRRLAKETGISQSEISRMYNGTKPWHPLILDMLEEMTNEDLTVTIPRCEDCGGAHHTRCHGKTGVAVILRDSEAIVERAALSMPKSPQRHRSGVSVTRATASQNERRKALNVSWADVVEAGLRAMEGAHGATPVTV